jgi:hypothetical protein
MCRHVEQWLIKRVDIVIYVGGDAWKGEIECAAIEWRQLFLLFPDQRGSGCAQVSCAFDWD